MPEHLPGMTFHGITEWQQGLGAMDIEEHQVPTPCPWEVPLPPVQKRAKQSKALYPVCRSRSTGTSCTPISSAPSSPAAPSSSSLHFPLTKEKSFCFWLLTIIMVQGSGLKTRETTPTSDYNHKRGEGATWAVEGAPACARGGAGWAGRTLQSKTSWNSVSHMNTAGRKELTKCSIQSCDSQDIPHLSHVPVPTESGACSDLF